jgi:hypothetical protein
MYPLPLEAFARLEFWPLGHDGSVLLSIVAQDLLCNFLCAGSSSSLLPAKPLTAISGSLGFYVLDSVLKPVTGIELPKEVLTSRVRWITLIIEWNAFSNMFYFLKNLLLIVLVILKLKCNNSIFNEIMVLNASYVCLHAFLLHQESPDLDPRRWTPHFWGSSITPWKAGQCCLM